MNGELLRLAFRPLTASDTDAMWQVVHQASHVEDDPPGTPDMRSNPDLIRHVAGWGRPGDMGVHASSAGQFIGAAWLRLLVGDERLAVEYVDAETPELVIAVLPGHEGRGIGGAMLAELLRRAEGRYPRIMLTVRSANRAARLYPRFGFVETARITNRIGAQSLVMVREQAAPSDPS